MNLSGANLLRLLPAHLSGDAQFAAAGEALRPYLDQLARFIPNLLLYARLGEAEPESFLPPLRRLTEARGGLSPLDMATLESLAWQFHVDFREVARNERELAGMVRDSIAWHRIKGTRASIEAALKLCGFSGITIEERDPNMPWACYQLGFAEIADTDELARIVAVCQEMQPARCRLWRVYVNDYDLRPGVWSGPLPRNSWSNAWWSRYSGSYFPEIPGLDDKGLMVSFGVKRKFQTEPWLTGPHLARIWQEQFFAALVHRLNHYIWSRSRWSDLYPMRYGFFGEQLLSTHSCELVAPPWADSPWPELPWSHGACWDLPRRPWLMPASSIPKSQGVYSDNSDKSRSAWSALNCNWSWPLWTETGPPPRWSHDKWSARFQKVRRVVILEQKRDVRSLQTEAMNPRPGDSLAGLIAHAIYLLARRNHLVWSASNYSQGIPRPQGMFLESIRAGLVAEPICAPRPWPPGQPWGETWREAPWGDVHPWAEAPWAESPWQPEGSPWLQEPWSRVLGYGRIEEPWRMRPGSLLKSQGIYSDSSAEKKSGWSRLNCNWGVPVLRAGGKAPRWSDGGVYSGKFDPVRVVPVAERRREVLAMAAPPLMAGVKGASHAIAGNMVLTGVERADAGSVQQEQTFTSVVRQPDTLDAPWDRHAAPWPRQPWPAKPWAPDTTPATGWLRDVWAARPWDADAKPWAQSPWEDQPWTDASENAAIWKAAPWPETPWTPLASAWKSAPWEEKPWAGRCAGDDGPWWRRPWPSRPWDSGASTWPRHPWGIRLPWEIYDPEAGKLLGFERPQQPFGALVTSIAEGDA